MAGLANGSRFPKLRMDRVGGGELLLPDDLAGRPAVVLAYRGAWCARCNAQLASYQHELSALSQAGIGVAAFSTDSAADAEGTVRKHGLEFPVGFGVDVEATAKVLEAYVNDEHRSLESTNFLLRPDGTIEIAVYSSGSIGRLVPDDIMEIVARRRERWV